MSTSRFPAFDVPVALSTMYMQHRTHSLSAFWELARDMGFDAIEASHIITEEHLHTLPDESIPIRSVHAPAPRGSTPPGWDAMRYISHPDPEKRHWAVQQVQRSIAWAADVGAQAVCVHLGVVEGLSREVWILEQRYLAGQLGSPQYTHQRDWLLKTRAERAQTYFEAAQRSLDALAEQAAQYGIRLGIESRRFYSEIPTLEEAVRLLEGHDPAVVGFWYDSGHCQVTANLGLTPHEEWLETLGDRIVGVHFHDVVGLRDHLIPGMGEIDFMRIAAYIPKEAVITLEVDWYFEPEELRSLLGRPPVP